MLKQNYQIQHKLILAGPNVGYEITKNLQKDIICTGYVTDDKKWELLKNADVFVFPSFYEGFGLPPLEAMGSGCPTVVARAGAMPEVCGEGALYVDPHIPEQIAAIVKGLLQDQGKRKELSEKGLMYASIVKKSGLHPFVVKKSYFLCRQFSFLELKKLSKSTPVFSFITLVNLKAFAQAFLSSWEIVSVLQYGSFSLSIRALSTA